VDRERVSPEQRRRRAARFGLYFSQLRAIKSLPLEVRPLIGMAAFDHRWSCAQTIAAVSVLRKAIDYADVAQPHYDRERIGGLLARAARDRIEWPADARVTLPIRPLARRMCATCARFFRPTRRDARYCSSRCRQRAYRKRKASRTFRPT
jgi:hypothetical protein